MNKKGLIVDIFRSSPFTGNTINKFCNFTELTCINMEGVFEPNEERPAIKLVKKNTRSGEHIHAEPVEPGSYAFGGEFIFSSDTRFWEISKYPIPLHDRQMNLEIRIKEI